MDLSNAIFTEHATLQMNGRGLTEAEVRSVLDAPETIIPVRQGRVVAQRACGNYLLRVFVDVDRQPVEVVTVFRTSQLKKYRSQS